MNYRDILPSLFTPNPLLFICEDIEFIQNFLKNQYKSSYSRLQSIYYIASSSVLGSLLYFSRPIPILFRCSIGVILIIFTKFGCPLLFRKFIAFNTRKRYKNFSDGLIYNNDILRKLLNLCEETQRVEQRCSYDSNWSTRLLQSTFQVNVKIFHLLREFTLRSFTDLGLPEGFDHVENYVSCLPLELFDDILTEKNPSIIHLKNLIKLTRIQQSQLVRRIFCSGLGDNKEYKFLKFIIKFINDVDKQLEPLRNQLTSLYTFHNALWTGENKTSTSNFDIDKFHLLTMIKLSRVHIRSSLFELNEIENTTSNYRISNLEELKNKLYNSEQELKNALIVIQKLLNELGKKIESKAPEKPIEIPEKIMESNVIIDENYHLEVTDRVFELDVEENAEIVPKEEIAKDDFCPELNEIFATLQEELQTALLPKANEHRIREANVLGVPVDSIPIQIGNKILKSSISDNLQSMNNAALDPPMKVISEESHDMISLLAKNASQMSKLYNVSSNIEKLGDFDDDDSDEERP